MWEVICKGYYGSYTWNETVWMDDDDDRDPIAVARHQMQGRGEMSLGMASFGGRVVDRIWHNQ